MKHWVVYDESGRIRQVANGPSPVIRAGLQCIEVGAEIADPSGWHVKDGAVVAYTDEQVASRQCRVVGSTWCNEAMAWVCNLPADVVLARAERAARTQRAALLAGSDWTQANDSPLSTDARLAWVAYRQALRDISLQPGWPLNIQWPVPPGHAG